MSTLYPPRAVRALRNLLFSLAVIAGALAWSDVATAQRTHVVRPGQSLARIAGRYGVSVSDLAAANGLGGAAALRPGQELRIPEAGVVYVREGQTLAEIARRASTTIAELVRINHLRDATAIRVGQRIILPSFVAAEEAAVSARRWGRPRRAGFATLVRPSRELTRRVRMLDSRGRATKAARQHLGELMRPNTATRRERFPDPSPRLIEVLARISDHFGGRPLHLLSGVRAAAGYTRESSRHVTGHAVDLRIPGVPNTELRDYARTLDMVGVGYYPRSTFVHIDVRDRSAYWVDWSRRGEAPRPQRRGEAPPEDATGAEASAVGEGGDDADEAGEAGAVDE